jgi:hypothetical protein
MRLIWDLEKKADWYLIALVIPSDMAELCTFLEKTHRHSEYDSEFENILHDWKQEGLFQSYVEELFKGRETVMIKCNFYGVFNKQDKDMESVRKLVDNFESYLQNRKIWFYSEVVALKEKEKIFS